jgi:hypothetical protein
MKSVISIACGLLLGIGTLSAGAAEVWHTAYVKRIYPTADGSVRLSFVTDHATCTNADSPKVYYITVGQNSVTADGLKAMHATALTAFAMERQVSIAFDNATASCYINRLIILDQ